MLIFNSAYKMITFHVYLNIFGAFLIAYYFMNKEKFISF